MAPPLIQLKDIRLTFGGTPLLAGVELSVSAEERVCLIGRNGSGKSTLLKIAAGLVEPDQGSRFVQPGTPIPPRRKRKYPGGSASRPRPSAAPTAIGRSSTIFRSGSSAAIASAS